jgi:dihydrofolate reductase
MAQLIYSAIGSLDGYVEDADGSFAWAAPDEEVLAFVNDEERPIGTYLYGRRMYETMVFWEGAAADPDLSDLSGLSDLERDYASIWQAADKIVFSRTPRAGSGARTRWEPEFTRELVTSLKAASQRDLSVGGADLAAEALRTGTVDEVRLLLHPVTVGGGKPILPGGVRLRLLGERRFGGGVVYLRYAVES